MAQLITPSARPQAGSIPGDSEAAPQGELPSRRIRQSDGHAGTGPAVGGAAAAR